MDVRSRFIWQCVSCVLEFDFDARGWHCHLLASQRVFAKIESYGEGVLAGGIGLFLEKQMSFTRKKRLFFEGSQF